MANEVKLTFRVDDAGTLTVFDKAGQKLRQVGTEAEHVGRKGTAALGGLQRAGALAGAALGVSLTGGLYSAGRALQSFLENTGRINDLSQAVGVSARDLSSLRVAAQTAGVSVQELADGLRFLNVNLVQAGEGTSKEARLLAALGVQSRDTMGVLLDVAAAFSQLADGPQKTAIAVELFGRSGMRLIPVLNEGRDGLRRLMLEARALGIELSDETVKAADDVGDNIDKLKLATEGFVNTLAGQLLPVMQSATTAMVQYAMTSREATASSLAESIERLVRAFQGLQGIGELPVLKQLRGLVLGLAGSGLDTVTSLLERFAGNGSAAGEFVGPPQEIAGPPLPPSGGGVPPNTAAIAQLLAGSEKKETGHVAAVKNLQQQAATLDAERFSQQDAIVGLLDAELMIREHSVERAGEQLRLAGQQGQSAEAQVRLAEQLDAAERARLLVVKDQLETQLLMQDLPPAADTVADVARLQAQLQIINDRLAVGPQHAAELATELARASEEASTLEEHFARAIDAILTRGGDGFDIPTLLKDVFQIDSSAILAKGLGQLARDLGLGSNANLTDIIGAGIKDLFAGVASLFQQGGDSSLVNGGTAQSVVARFRSGGSSISSPRTRPLPADIQGPPEPVSFGADFGEFALENAGVLGAAGVQTIDRVTNGAVGGFGLGALEVGAQIAPLVSQIPIVGWVAAIAVVVVSAIVDGLAEAFKQDPTKGTLVKERVATMLTKAQLPRQQLLEGGGREGVRIPSFEQSADQETFDYFKSLGFDRTGIIQDKALANALAPGIDRVAPVREEALAIGAILEKSPREATNAANTLLNNFNLLGIGSDEARRQLLKLADIAGITLVSGLEELSKKLSEGRIDPKQAQGVALGLVQLFQDQLPKGVDAEEIKQIIARRTTATGINIAGLQGDIERFGIAEDLRDDVKERRFDLLNSRKQDLDLRRQLSEVDAKLANTTLSDGERQKLLEERADIGFRLSDVGAARFSDGSAAERRAIEFGLSIVEESAKQLESFGIDLQTGTEKQIAATDSLTVATTATKQSLDHLSAQLQRGITGQIDFNIHGGAGSGDAQAVAAAAARAVQDYVKSPAFRAAVRNATTSG